MDYFECVVHIAILRLHRMLYGELSAFASDKMLSLAFVRLESIEISFETLNLNLCESKKGFGD